MDTTETYIKMCDCEEIQESWQITDWDYCYCEKTERVVVLSGYETDSGYYGHGVDSSIFKDGVRIIGTVAENGGCGDEGKHIWLPRQDQLQAMMGEEYAINLLYGFHHFYNTQKDYPPPGLSMEQLWLAFVMKSLYSKIWDGGNWVASC